MLPPASTALCIADLNHDISASLFCYLGNYSSFCFFVFLDAAGLEGEMKTVVEEWG